MYVFRTFFQSMSLISLSSAFPLFFFSPSLSISTQNGTTIVATRCGQNSSGPCFRSSKISPSFAGMGAMTNPRLGLFLAQTTKALGVNCKLQQRPQLTSTVACMAA